MLEKVEKGEKGDRANRPILRVTIFLNSEKAGAFQSFQSPTKGKATLLLVFTIILFNEINSIG